ncbi:MAG: transglycosylase SLT domain-containing protein, partial [Alphaproteobacteria bacterium]
MVKKVFASLRDINKPGSLAAVIALVTIATFGMIIMISTKQSSALPSSVPMTAQLFARHDTGSQLPVLLNTKDNNLYRDIFRAQDNRKWKEADWLAEQLSSKHLMGHVLGERYLHPSYPSSAAELANWLKQYSDHPQAYRIYTLALRKNPQMKLTPVYKKRILQGYGDDNGLASWMAKSSYTQSWNHAVDAWRRQDNVQAARLFSTLAGQTGLHTWKKSASAFWAWRAYDSLGNKSQAEHYLHMAAQYPRTFYGVLARQKLGRSLALDSTPEALSDTEVLELMGEQVIRRIISLARIDATDLADAEMRQLFPTASTEEKYRLLTIASELNLASAQIAMARQLATQDQRLDFARYPIPAWQPHSGFRIDPALIYAMARQESGFRNDAVSHAGATGVMQL